MNTPVYEIKNITQRYNARLALDVEHLCIEQGAITGLAGHNGSGKSTLMRMLAFLENPKEGTIFFMGRKLQDAQHLTALRKKVALLTQEPYLLKRSVFANVAYGLKLRGENNAMPRVREGLQMVGSIRIISGAVPGMNSQGAKRNE